METEYILTIIGGFLIYATALIGVYVNIKVQLKELDIKYQNLKSEVDQHKLTTGVNVLRLEERNTLEHDSIIVKIDSLINKVTEIRVEQATVSATLTKSNKTKLP